jgi:hypothetical protein
MTANRHVSAQMPDIAKLAGLPISALRAENDPQPVALDGLLRRIVAGAGPAQRRDARRNRADREELLTVSANQLGAGLLNREPPAWTSVDAE